MRQWPALRRRHAGLFRSEGPPAAPRRSGDARCDHLHAASNHMVIRARWHSHLDHYSRTRADERSFPLVAFGLQGPANLRPLSKRPWIGAGDGGSRGSAIRNRRTGISRAKVFRLPARSSDTRSRRTQSGSNHQLWNGHKGAPSCRAACVASHSQSAKANPSCRPTPSPCPAC